MNPLVGRIRRRSVAHSGSSRNPPSVRIPIGYQADPFNLSLGRPLFAAKDIRAPVLVVRGEFDFGHVQQISIPLQGTSSIRPRLRRLRLEAGPTTCMCKKAQAKSRRVAF